MKEANADGVVIGVSGGIDSACVLALTHHAITPKKIFGLILPSKTTPREDVIDAIGLCQQFHVRAHVVPIQGIVDSLTEVMSPLIDEPNEVPLGNIQARVRMTILYYYANQYNMLVAGTGDFSEHTLGFFTKYGDGANDFEPILHLYKGEVRRMAEYLQVPAHIVQKPSSPGILKDKDAYSELGHTYEEIDEMIRTATLTDALKERVYRNLHKKTVPKSLKRVEAE